MIEGKIIAVSGIMGSGKTTLCRNLAHKIGWSSLQEPVLAKSYLVDFFNDLNRYAYHTQIAFLSNKALQIIETLQKGQNIIVDRSLYEDIYIFAKCWHDRGNIDDRDFAVYNNLAEFFLEQLPKPQLIFYCECSLSEAKERIEKRDRYDQKEFPPDHLEDIKKRYDNWIANYNDSPVYSINTEQYDVRKERIIGKIVQEILNLGVEKQLTLFDYENLDISTSERILVPVNNVDSLLYNYKLVSFSPQVKSLPYRLVRPWAYLAAPFTSLATLDNPVYSTDLQISFEQAIPLHGIIKPGDFKRMLIGVEKRLSKLHIDTLIPHRDINSWGEKILTPQDATSNCEYYVKECDLFIGIIGDSSGSHYELGIAEGKSKPIVIIQCDEIETSFIGRGIKDNNNRLVLHCEKITDIPKLFSTEEFLSFTYKKIYKAERGKL